MAGAPQRDNDTDRALPHGVRRELPERDAASAGSSFGSHGRVRHHGEPLLRLDSVHKSFPGVRALKPLSLEVEAGEVLGLVGENGAGKSTLIHLLSGVHAPDGGTIAWKGSPVRFESPRDAIEAGIATIHQELSYCGRLSVAENLLLGEVWPRCRWGGVDWRRFHADAAERLRRFGLDIPTHRFFHALSAAEKQEVAIARALSQSARLLILDEPTASLSEPEAERLFAHLGRLKSEGIALIYVSHRLDEVLKLTDRIAVLRDGELAHVYPTREADIRRLVRDMVGRSLDEAAFAASVPTSGAPLLELEGVTRAGMFEDITFTLRAGEVVGLGGLAGAGRSELARAIHGLYPIERGSMKLKGRPWRPAGPWDSLRAGLVYLPEERKRQALVLDHSLGDSISIGFSDLISRWGLIRRREEASRIDSAVTTHSIRSRSIAQPVGTLSGGNQQKALLARWLGRDPDVIILDEPTRGVDVAAKAEIHAFIRALAERGKAVLLISSDLPELLHASQRVLVLHRGRIAAELRGVEMTQENVLLAASGLPGAGKRSHA